MSLQQIINQSLKTFFRRIVSLLLPAVAVFLIPAAADLLLTAAGGLLSGWFATVLGWVKLVLVTLMALAAAGFVVGANGVTVSADLDGEEGVLAKSCSTALSRLGALFAGMVFYHVVVVGAALPGLGLFGASLWFSFHQNFLYSLGCIVGGALLLYYPMKLFLQMILFGFVIVGEGASGWASLFRSRQIVNMQPEGSGMGSGNTAKVLILLHVSLVPAFLLFIVMMVPLAVMVLVGSPEQNLQNLSGERLTTVYVAGQLMNALMMGLIIPMFTVPLAVLYHGAAARPADRGQEPAR